MQYSSMSPNGRYVHTSKELNGEQSSTAQQSKKRPNYHDDPIPGTSSDSPEQLSTLNHRKRPRIDSYERVPNSSEELLTSTSNETSDEESSTSSIRENSSDSIFNHRTTVEASLPNRKRKMNGFEENTPDDDDAPNSKIPRTSTSSTEESETAMTSTSKTHRISKGLKNFLPGICYQLKILMHLFKNSLDNKPHFELATEMAEAEKFDDVVIRYKEADNTWVYRFLQAKHINSRKKYILTSDLLTEEGDFSLQKYFLSYQKMKNDPRYKGCNLKDFVIFTNIGLNLKPKSADEYWYLEPSPESDNIFHLFKRDVKLLKFNFRKFPKIAELKNKLSETLSCKRLAKQLAKCVKCEATIDFGNELFKLFHRPLRKHVIEVGNNRGSEGKNQNAKFYQNFVSNTNSSDLVKKFRAAFFKAYQEIEKQKMNEDAFWRDMENKTLNISRPFATYFDLVDNPQLSDCEKLAIFIAKKMTESDGDVVKLVKTGVLLKNIRELAGHVFIKKKTSKKDTYCFSRMFLEDNHPLSGNLTDFRRKLVAELEKKGKSLNNEYKFHIATFSTCQEEELSSLPSDLPDDNDRVPEEDITEFFDKLAFAIGMPNLTKLDSIIKKDMSQKFKFKISELFTSSLETFILNWMRAKEGRFLTKQDGEKIFEQLGRKMFVLQLHTLTSQHGKTIERYKIKFKNDLLTFLNSPQQQVFIVTSSLETTRLSSVKVWYIINENPAYKTNDSFIFLPLRIILDNKKDIIKAFNSDAILNLLVIEWEITETDNLPIGKKVVKKLFNEISLIAKDKTNKKIVLIAYKNNKHTEIFKNSFKDFKIREIKDEKNSLGDLTEDSQKKILQNRKFKFQEGRKNLDLNTFLGDESNQILQKVVKDELLFKLIKNEKIMMGKAPKDLQYDAAKDYFIERSFYRHVNIKAEFQTNKSDFVIINEPKKITKFETPTTQDLILISSEDEDIENFEEWCNTHKKNNIHWLKKIQNEFTWQKSQGSVSKLREFVVISENNKTTCSPKKITDIPDRVVLIVGEPGMGKSVTLSHLALNTQHSSSPLWIVRCNLVDYCDSFGKLIDTGENITTIDALRFLYEIADFQHIKDESEKLKISDYLNIKGNDNKAYLRQKNDQKNWKEMSSLMQFETEIFIHSYNQKNVALLLDGFDEIFPIYEKVVIKLIKLLEPSMKKIYITTRSLDHIESELEDNFSTFSFKLEPFTRKDQEKFAKKYLRKCLEYHELDERRFKIFTETLLLETFAEYTHTDFFKVPLQMHFSAEVFLNSFKQVHSVDGHAPNENKLRSSIHEMLFESQDDFDRKLAVHFILENFWWKSLKPNNLGERHSEILTKMLQITLYNSTDVQELSQNSRDTLIASSHAPPEKYKITSVLNSSKIKKFHKSNHPIISEFNKQEFTDIMNFSSLYEDFIDKKYIIEREKECADYTENMHKPGQIEMYKYEHKDSLRTHRILAARTIFENEIDTFRIEPELRNIDEVIDKVKKRKVKTGIIDRICQDQPIFILPSFAEYFAADYLWDKFKSIPYPEINEGQYYELFLKNIIIDNLIENDRIKICTFLKSKAEKDLESDGNDIKHEKNKFEALMIQLFNKIKKFAQITHTDGEKDRQFNQSFILLLGIIEFTFRVDRKNRGNLTSDTIKDLKEFEYYQLLRACINTGYVKLAKKLLLTKKPTTKFLRHYVRHNGWMGSILMRAIITAQRDIVELLVHGQVYNENWLDKDKKTLFSHIMDTDSYEVLKSCSEMHNICNVNEVYQREFPSKIRFSVKKTNISTCGILKECENVKRFNY